MNAMNWLVVYPEALLLLMACAVALVDLFVTDPKRRPTFWLAALAATALIFGAAYSLWMYKRVYFGEVANDHVRELKDLNAREFGIMAVLAIATLWMGVYPKPFTDVMHVSVTELLKHVAVSKLQ